MVRFRIFAVALFLAIGALAAPFALAQSNTRLERQHEDLEFAKSNYVMKSLALSPTARRSAIAFIDQLSAQTTALSNADFMLAMVRIAAFAGNAHDSFFPADGWIPPARLPLRVIWFPDDMVIARTAPAQAALLGATVRKIEGLTPAELLARLRRYSGGTEEYARWNLTWLIENGGLLHALGFARAPDKIEFDLTLANGEREHRAVNFAPRAEYPKGVVPAQLWSSDLTDAEIEKDWRAATTPEGDPLYLKDGTTFFRIVRLPELDALYLQFRANSEADALGEDIEAFVRVVQSQIRRTESGAIPRNLIFDVRFNVGGDIDKTRGLIRELAQTIEGRIYVMTGGYTFSAGLVAAAAMVHDGGERVTIVGDTVGDRLRFWSEGREVCAPNSHYCLHATDGKWDLVKGCKGTPGCYGDPYDARVKSLVPSLQAPLTAKMWRARRDPGMEAIRADLAARTGR